MEKIGDSNLKNLVITGEKDNSKSDNFFLPTEVDMGCFKPIHERFKVLLDTKKLIQQNVADSLGIDKAYISRIFNGIEVPPHHLRLKIAGFFGVDSSTIWRVEDLYYLKSKLEQRK